MRLSFFDTNSAQELVSVTTKREGKLKEHCDQVDQR